MAFTLIGATELFAHWSLRLIGYQSRRVATSVGDVHAFDGRGDGNLPTVVLLHGFSAEAVHYATLMRNLRPHVRRIVVPDFPAHGRSDVPSPIDGPHLRRGLFEALDQLLPDDESAVFFGNSMGGHAAIAYAKARPAKVAGLMLCSPGGAPMSQAELTQFIERFHLDSHAQALDFTDRLFARRAALRQLVAWGVRQKFSRPVLRQLLAGLRPEDCLTPAEVRGVTQPFLILWGRADQILPPEHREFFRRNLPPQARLFEPDGCGHSPYLDAPRDMAERLLSFMADVDGQRQMLRQQDAAELARAS